MSAFLALGILFLVLGLVFLIIPFEKLKVVFRRMRSPVTTKVGGAVFFLAGIASLLFSLRQ